MSDVKAIERAIDELRHTADNLGLDPGDVNFELVPPEIMYEIAATALPVRFHHWTHGIDYFRNKTTYDFGMQRIYELVVNTAPAQAWLMDSNSLVAQKLVIAHVYGHADFFRRNQIFKSTNRQMAKTAQAHAEHIAALEEEHGLEAVEELLDAALSIGMHIDLNYTKPSEEKKTCSCAVSEYDDVWNLSGKSCPHRSAVKPEKKILEPQSDLLKFLADSSPALEGWQREILEIVREEWLYFWPNVLTKIANEGWATFWHERILENANLSPEEHVQFRQIHTGVIGSASRYSINPYQLGYSLWKSIEVPPEQEKTWFGDYVSREGGARKLFDAAATYSDSEFVRNFLTEQTVRDLDLYVYSLEGEKWTVGDVGWKRIRQTLANDLLAVRPSIQVVDEDYKRQRQLLLKHDFDSDKKPLDSVMAFRVLTQVNKLWGRKVVLQSSDGTMEYGD